MTNDSLSSTTHTNVMRRVRTIHALRPILSGGTFAALAFLLALYGIGREVWVAKIVANMPSISDAADVVRFFLAAFLHTAISVQALTIIAAFALIFLAREMARALALTLRSSSPVSA